MKTIKVSEATKHQLDWLVANCEHDKLAALSIQYPEHAKHYPKVSPSTDWSQMGPIIDREDIDITSVGVKNYRGRIEGGNPVSGYGPSRIIAAARCFIVSKLGATVEVPEELS